MVDLSKHPCPWCGNTQENHADYQAASCGDSQCWKKVVNDLGGEEDHAAAWIELSEKVHGKPHDGPMVDVRIAVAVDQTGGWGMEPIIGDHSAAFHAAGEELFGSRVCHIVTATLPLPVAKEIKGRVEG